MANSSRQLLTVPEAAERLHVSPRTVRRRIASGELPAVRLGSGPQAPVRVDPAELDRFIFGQPPAALPEPPTEEAACLA